MRHLTTVLLLLGALAAAPRVARAQDAESGVRGYAAVGTTTFTAADTFTAVAGTNRRTNIGGGVIATFWKGLFADASFS